MLINRYQSVICTVNYQAGTKNAEDHNGRHHVIGNKLKNTVLCKKPILIVVYRVSKHRPHENYKYTAKLYPDFFNIQLYYAKGKIQHAPVEKQAVEHKCLKDDVAERRLTAESRAGVAHPHQRGCDRKNDYCGLKPFKMPIKLCKCRPNAHKRAYVERKLVNADSVIAIGKRHYKEIGNVKTDSKRGKNSKQLGLSAVALVSEAN